jgi:hypothetical protein
MTSIAAIRDGLKTRLATIAGLHCYDTVPGSIMSPAAVVAPAAGEFLRYDQSMGPAGVDTLTMTVTLFVANTDTQQAQESLDAYLHDTDATSVRAAIAGGGTLGGTADFAVLETARNYGIVKFGEIEYLSVELVVSIGAV